MTIDEIRNLKTGDVVSVTWFGGNGPHTYWIIHADSGDILACREGQPQNQGNVLYDALRDKDAKSAIHQVSLVVS